MPYGKKECVDWLIRDMISQKLQMRLYKEGEPDQFVWIDCQVRILPFGLYEFVFPKEHMGPVLTALTFNNPTPDGIYNLNREVSILGMKFRPLDYAKKFLRIEDPPEFKTDRALLWWNQHIGILTLGIRHDGEITENQGEYAGWTHEAI